LITPLNLTTEHATFLFHGNVVIANALDPDTKQPIPAGRLDYMFDSFVEVPMYFNGSDYFCQNGKTLSPTYASLSSMFYGTLKILNISESGLCDMSFQNITIAPGKFANAVVVLISWPTEPNLTVKLTFGLVATPETVVTRHFAPSYTTAYHELNFTYQYVENGRRCCLSAITIKTVSLTKVVMLCALTSRSVNFATGPMC